ncbi:MAG: hypothetical protein ACQUHE_17515 [Bacteroidia bacterium]
MNIRYLLAIILTVFCLSACKKDPVPAIENPKEETPDGVDLPNVSYKLINRKLHASHPSAMNLDVNEDGIIDLSYFMQYVVLGGHVNLYIGVNPVFGSATRASEHDNNEFLNMGTIHSITLKTVVKEELDWTEDHAMLANRREAPNGTKTYLGNWGDGQQKFMALRLRVHGKLHYGWAQLKFNKETEELILIDVAWNTNAEQEIPVGAK